MGLDSIFGYLGSLYRPDLVVVSVSLCLGVLVFESKPYLREAAGLLLQDFYLNRWPLFMVGRLPEIELHRTAYSHLSTINC